MTLDYWQNSRSCYALFYEAECCAKHASCRRYYHIIWLHSDYAMLDCLYCVVRTLGSSSRAYELWHAVCAFIGSIYVYMRHIYIYIYTSMCIHVYIYIYIYTHTHICVYRERYVTFYAVYSIVHLMSCAAHYMHDIVCDQSAAHTLVSESVHIYIYIYIFIQLYTYTHICM